MPVCVEVIYILGVVAYDLVLNIETLSVWKEEGVYLSDTKHIVPLQEHKSD